MERRNAPTPINYRPEGNSNTPYPDADVRGIQIKQPFADDGNENTMVFHLPTTGFENVMFAFAAMDEGAADNLIIDYSVNPESPEWTTEGMQQTIFPLLFEEYQLYEISFAAIQETKHNPDFMIRIRFSGEDMEADNGNRVTFNNFSLDGSTMDIDYYTVSFNVVDANGFDIDDAVITFGDITNEPGNYLFDNIEEGTYSWSVNRLCYLDSAGELTVNENVETEIILELDLLHGDANGDGAVNVLDIILMASYYSGNAPQNFCFYNADINEDGAVNILDIIATVNIFTESKSTPDSRN